MLVHLWSRKNYKHDRERDKFGVEVNKVLLKDVNTIVKLGIIISKNDIT